jgi:hypothetical protein
MVLDSVQLCDLSDAAILDLADSYLNEVDDTDERFKSKDRSKELAAVLCAVGSRLRKQNRKTR